MAAAIGHSHYENFENIPTQGLVTGVNELTVVMGIIIPGSPGFNAIDNSLTPDPFSDMLSPNGSTYYLGDVGVNSFPETSLTFEDLDFQVTGIGANWVVQGDLLLDIQGTIVSFADYLPTGTGFLGISTDQTESTLTVNLSGDAVFGIDDIRTINAPIPAAVWLFSSGLIGLVGLARRKKS